MNVHSAGIDELAQVAGLTLLQSMRALLNLQLKNLASEVSKNRYIRKIA